MALLPEHTALLYRIYTLETMKDNMNLTEWSNNMHQAYGKNGMIAIAFYLSCVLRKSFNQRPILHINGKAATGKTSMADSIASAFENKKVVGRLGELEYTFSKEEGISINLTDGTCIVSGAHIEDIHEVERMKNFYSHKEFSLIATSQQKPYDIPQFARTISIELARTLRNADTNNSFKQLKDVENTTGFSYLEAEVKHSADWLFRTYYFDEYDKVYRDLKSEMKANFDFRILGNYTNLLTPFKIASSKIQFSFSYQSLFDYTVELLKKQIGDINDLCASIRNELEKNEESI